MSTTIEQRVVEMQFDNKQFERNVADTMSTLDKFKQKLNLTGSAKGLEEISNSAKRFDMSGVMNAVDMVNSRFSALGIMGVTALQNITNTAVNAGKRMISALTIDPIRTGFSEYETKINSIQTIMSNTSSKGTTMEDVTRVIGELNTYADKTIYNFAEMTRNIGTFTAAGIGLEDSASSIQGIANLAAASGSTSQQASTAMYQLSQAMSSGVVKLMDWNSVVNAGMGGQKFQDALKATAREHGVAIDEIIEKQGSFRESLSEGWLTADLLKTTLQKFTTGGAKDYAKAMMDAGKWTQAEADALLKEAQAMEDAATKVKTFTQLWDTLKESAQSGWGQTWEILVGDFEEAKETLTQISDVIGEVINKSAEARNKLLQGWKDAGGRADIVDSFFNVIEAIKSVVTPIKEAFREIFPPTTVEQLKGFSEGLKEFTSKLKLSETASENLKRTFKGVFAVFDILKQALSAVFDLVKPLFGGLDDLGGGFLGVTAAIGDWLVKLDETIKTTDIFGKAVEKISGFVKMAYEGFRKFADIVKEKFAVPGLEALQKIFGRIKERMSGVGDAASAMKDGVSAAVDAMGEAFSGSSFFKLLGTLWTVIKTIGTGIVQLLGKLFGGLSDALGNLNFSGFFDFINSLSFSAIAVFIAKFIKGFSDITESVGSFKDSAIGILDSVKGCFEAYQNQLNAGTLMKIAGAIAILVGAILVLSLIDSDKLNTAIGAITLLFTDLMGSMAIMSKLNNLGELAKISIGMVGMSIAILILAAALKTVSDLEVGELAKGIIGIVALTGTLVGAVKLLSMGKKNVIKGAMQMVIFAAAIKVLASVCEDLSSLSWEELAKGLAGVGILLAEVSLFMNTAKFSKNSMSSALSVVVLGAALKILVSVCKDFGQMNWTEIGKGLLGIAAVLAAVAIALNFMPGPSSLAGATSMVIVSAALLILAQAMKSISTLSWGDLAKSLVAIGGALAILAVGLTFMTGTLGGAAALTVASVALLMLTSALTSLGELSWSEVAKSLVAIAGALTILAVGLTFMTGAVPGAAALILVSAALLTLTPVLLALGNMSWGEIVKGLVALAGTFVVLGVAGAVLGYLAPVMLAFGASIALIGVGVLALGAGLAVAAVGVSALATALAAGATAIMAGISVIVLGIAELLPIVAIKIGEAIIALCQVIIDSAPVIGDALSALVKLAIEILVEHAPALAEGLLTCLVELLALLANYTPQIVDYLFDFIIALINGISARMPELIQALTNVFVALFKGVFEALANMDTSTILETVAGIGLLVGVIAGLSAITSLIPGAMAGVLGMAAVVAEIGVMLAALGAIAQIPGLEWLISEGGDFLQAIGNALGQFVGGLIGGIAEGVTSSLPKIGSDLSNFMINATPFIEGARLIDSTTMEGVLSLAKVILTLTAANILDGLTSWFTGGTSIVKFGKDLAEFGPYFNKYYNSIKGVDGAVVSGSANAALALAEMASKLPNSGGVVSWFTGDNTLTAFADELVKFGPSMKKYADSVKGIDGAAVTASANSAKALSEIAKNLPNSGGMVSWFTGDNDISDFGESLVDFGGAIKKYADKVKGINVQQLTGSVNGLKNIVSLAKSTAGTDFGNLEKFAKSLDSLGTKGVDAFVKAFTDAKKKINQAGSDMMMGVVDGVEAKKVAASNAFSTIVRTIVASLAQSISLFRTMGGNLATGFASGISDNAYKAVAKARAMAAAAADAANEELDIHSPSRVLYETGKNAGLGFVNALSDYAEVSYDAGSSMADSARDGLNAAVKTINDIVTGDMNLQPSICPVVDLSNVKSAAGSISRLFGSDPTLGISGNLASISAGMNQRGQNGDNGDIISALDKLRKDISNMPRNSYNINGVSYSDDSGLKEAFETIIHRALIERRV